MNAISRVSLPVIYNDGDIATVADVSIDGDTTTYWFTVNEADELSVTQTVMIPTDLAVRHARAVLFAAGVVA